MKYPLLITAVLASSLPLFAHAATPKYVICEREETGVITLRPRKCKRTETKINNSSMLIGTPGSNGTDGADGADGSIRIYGDGSAGDLHVTSSSTFDSDNTQYSSVTIDTGVTLTIDSGTVLRVTGTFTNNGTIEVRPYAVGAQFNSTGTTSGTSPSILPAHPGIAAAAGSQPAFGDDSAILAGGSYGIAMFEGAARGVLLPGVHGGSGGGAGAFGNSGGRGGGTLTVLAAGAITNGGTIAADGGDGGSGSGGGGGGVVILASQTAVTNSTGASISANGGAGGPSNVNSGGGGGGGGGLVHLISPTTPVNNGSITVTAGAPGSNATSVANTPRSGGGGGGSCGGEGGPGSSVSTLGTSAGNSSGSDGFQFLDAVDPTSLF